MSDDGTRIRIMIERGGDYEGDEYWSIVAQVTLPLVGKQKDRQLRALLANLAEVATKSDTAPPTRLERVGE